MIITDRPGDYPYLWSWLAERTGLPWSTDMRTIGLTDSSDRIIAVTAFASWLHGTQCFIHFAADAPISRSYIKAVFRYVFSDHRILSVLGLVADDNLKIRDFMQRIGFRPKVELNGSTLFEMTPYECKWVKDYGKEIISAAGS